METDPHPRHLSDANVAPTFDRGQDAAATPVGNTASRARDTDSDLPPAELDRLCDEFDAAWRAKQSPRIEDYLARVGRPFEEWLLRHLLAIEIDYRRKAGDDVKGEDYEDRFPQHAELVRDAVQGGLQHGKPPLQGEATPAPRVLGDYEVFEKLGGGGMGVVYKARHRRLHRWVALKELHSGCMSQPESLRRFMAEMEAIGQLNHPNLVLCTDAREEAGVPFLVMEYIEGKDLAAIVKQRGRLSVADACEVVRQAAAGLRHVYEQDSCIATSSPRT